MPLEYLGFIPELYDVNQELPEVSPNSGYAGVVSMNLDIRSEKIESWLLQAKDAGLKIFLSMTYRLEKIHQLLLNLELIL